MKRLGKIWDSIPTEENGLAAVIEGTKTKRGDRSVSRLLYSEEAVRDDPSLWHLIDPEKAKKYIKPINEKLIAGTWKHSAPRYRRHFCRNRSNGGKWRNLYIPCLEDHIVAHMVMNQSFPAFTKGMHPHCCGNVPDRGIKHVLRMCNAWFRHDLECRYFVKLDIRHFFDSIDKDILIQKIESKIKDKRTLEIHKQIVMSAPVACPVGYYTSPWYANLYLEKLDWFIEQRLYKERRGKRIKYVRHYLRYADDMLLMGTSKSDLRKSVKAIMAQLSLLGLELKPTWEIKRIGRHSVVDGKRRMVDGYWCDIGGYKFCRDATVMRDGIFLHTRRLAREIYKKGYASAHECKSLLSSLGWAGHSDSNHFYQVDILPYVNVKRIRRQVSHVDKNGEWKRREARARREIQRAGNPQEKL